MSEWSRSIEELSLLVVKRAQSEQEFMELWTALGLVVRYIATHEEPVPPKAGWTPTQEEWDRVRAAVANRFASHCERCTHRQHDGWCTERPHGDPCSCRMPLAPVTPSPSADRPREEER